MMMNNLSFIAGLFFYNYELIIHNVYYLYSYQYLSTTKPEKDKLTNPTLEELTTRKQYAQELLDKRLWDKWKAVKNLSNTPKQVILADLLHIGEIDHYRKTMQKGTFKLAFFPLSWGIALMELGNKKATWIGMIILSSFGVALAFFFNIANNEYLILYNTRLKVISESIYWEFFSLIFLILYIILTRIIVVDFILDRRQTKALNEALHQLIRYYNQQINRIKEKEEDVLETENETKAITKVP